MGTSTDSGVDQGLDHQSHKLAGEGSSPSPATKFYSPTDVLKYLGRITYKPGYKFTYWVDDKNQSTYRQNIVLNLVVPVPDSTRKDQKPVTIVFTNRIPFEYLYHNGPNYLLVRVRDFFLEWEKHEMDEWFRLDGEMVRDPHAGDCR